MRCATSATVLVHVLFIEQLRVNYGSHPIVGAEGFLNDRTGGTA